MNTLQDYLATHDAGDLLDIACGNGRFTKILVDGSRSWRSVTGLDIKASAEADFLETMGTENVTFVSDLADGWLGRGPTGRFDTISISNALHHIEGIGELLAQLRGPLRAGGVVIVNEMHADDLTPAQETQRDLHAFLAEMHTLAGEHHRAVFPRAEIEAMIAGAGLQVAHVFHAANADQINTDSPMPSRLGDAIEAAYPDGAPDEVIARRDEILKRVEETGVGTPPQLTFVCRFDAA